MTNQLQPGDRVRVRFNGVLRRIDGGRLVVEMEDGYLLHLPPDTVHPPIRGYIHGPLTDDDSRHGTSNGYQRWGCRCERCRHASTADTMAFRRDRPPLEPDDPRHGTRNGYSNWYCRCQPCTDANRDSQRQRASRLKAAATP